mgnify:FL=1|jgi:hypothetical protein
MNSNRTFYILLVTVVLLVICNIGLMFTIWHKPHPDGPPPPPPGGHGPRNFVIEHLNLNNDQISKYDQLIKEHQQSMTDLRQSAAGLRAVLFAALERQDTHFTDSVASLIAGKQKEIELVTYAHFGQLRALCTDSQKKGLDNIMSDVIKKMNGSPNRPADRPGPPPGDGHEAPPPPPGN